MEALKLVFDAQYPVEDFRELPVTMEYPADSIFYPGIWVDFEPTQPLQVAGIGHTEYVHDTNGLPHQTTRWRFAGMIQLTLMALTSLERDRLADELVRVLAFGRQSPETSRFRDSVLTNDLIILQLQEDNIAFSGKAENPGTPWGTDDIVYEITATIDCQGEFICDTLSGALATFSSIVVYSAPDGDPAPTIPDAVVPASNLIAAGNESWQ